MRIALYDKETTQVLSIRTIHRDNLQRFLGKYYNYGVLEKLPNGLKCGHFIDKRTYNDAKASVHQSSIVGKRILITRRAIGDVLLSLPAVEALYLNSGCDIHYASDKHILPLLNMQYFIKEAIDIKSRIDHNAFGTVFNLEGMVDYLPICATQPRNVLFEKQLLVDQPANGEYIQVSSDLDRYAEETLSTLKRPIIVLQPTTKSFLRNWGKELELISKLKYNYVVVSNKPNSFFDEYDNVLNLTGHTDILQLSAIIKRADLSVVPDSAVMHIAGFLKKKCIAIFGAIIPPELRINIYNTVFPIITTYDKTKCPYIPCYDWQVGQCSKGENYRWCMESISVEEVIQKTNQVLEV